MTRLTGRVITLMRRHPFAADATVAALFAVAALVSVKSILDEYRSFDPSYPKPTSAAVIVAMLATTLPLAWRRRYPISTASVVVAAFLYARIIVDVPESSMTLLAGSLALYSVAVHGRPHARTLVLSLFLGAIVAEVVRELFFVAPGSNLRPLAQVFLLVYNVVVLALPWALGAVIRSLREREQELAERATELQREREENARQAVFAERVRIARELHDVVAHHVSVMGVQAGAARRVMTQHPEQAAQALTSIEASSRTAVVELHRLLGFLRASDQADELAPQPGLGQLGDLLAQGDLRVDLLIEGKPHPLPPTLEVSAYRIVQEALTNARKHSMGSSATVRISYGDAKLDIEVIDDGPALVSSAITTQGGHGLIGMRERATLHGGHLRAGPRADGGFAVHATFPLDRPTQ